MRKKIAILFLGDFFYDARTINMAIALSSNHSVTVIASFKKQINSPLFNKITFYKINIKKMGWLKYLEYHYKASSFLKNKNFDFVISGDLYSLSASSLNKKNNKIIYDCREIYSALSAHINKPIYRFICFLYENFFMKYVDDVVVTAQTDLLFLKKKYSNFSHLNWHLIYNYPFGSFEKKQQKIRIKYSIPDNHYILLYHGVLHKGRGLSQLIKLTSKLSNITSIIIGDGVDKKKYIKIAAGLNLKKRVIFISKIPYLNLLNYASACDFGWCLIDDKSLSYKYALPNKLFEYLFAGLPIIASRSINIQKIIEKYGVGLCVDYNNAQQQIDAVLFLIKNQKESIYYQQIASKNFIWDKQKINFLKIFN